MNIYELFEVLKRQKVLMTTGSMIVIVLVAVVFLATPPKFTATLRMIVVQDGVSTLTDAGLASSDYFRIAAIYGDLLSSPEAIEEITEAGDIGISGFRVRTLNEVSAVEVAVDAERAEVAEAVALDAFAWLERRIRRSSEVLFTPVEEEVAPAIAVDEDGRVTVSVNIFVEPSFVTADPSIWFEVDTPVSEDFAAPLVLLESGMSFEATIDPSENLAVNIGPETGAVFDEVQVNVPDLPDEPVAGISLDLYVRRGAVLFSSGDDLDARLNPSAFSLRWDNPATVAAGQGKIAVLLMNPDLAAVPVGQRRAPIFAGAVLMLGIASLVIVSTARDGWQRRRGETRVATPPEVVPVRQDLSTQARS